MNDKYNQFYRDMFNDEKKLMEAIKEIESERIKTRKKISLFTKTMMLNALLSVLGVIVLMVLLNTNVVNSSLVGDLTIAMNIALLFATSELGNKKSNLNNSLKELNASLNGAKARYRELTNLKTNVNDKTNENTSVNDKEVSKDLEQVFNEVIDEEYTLEDKPKVRTRK